MNAAAVKQDLEKLSNKKRAAVSRRFFKCGSGEYGEGDRFIGVSVPQLRSLAKKYQESSLQTIEQLLHDPVHECRLFAVFVLVDRFQRGDEAVRKTVVDLYVKSIPWINSWDLVDASAYQILGIHLLSRDRSLLDQFAKKDHLWTQRIAIVATYAFIKEGQCAYTFHIANILRSHPHDLIHKAVGWMLREAGKRDEKSLRKFLKLRYKTMPRTMLRYAIEKFPNEERMMYLTGVVL